MMPTFCVNGSAPGKSGVKNLDDTLFFVIHEPIGRVVQPGGEIAHFAAAIAGGLDFARRSSGVFFPFLIIRAMQSESSKNVTQSKPLKLTTQYSASLESSRVKPT